ncbi:MAG: peptide deformylase [Candidatus Aminicenantales bacterium]
MARLSIVTYGHPVLSQKAEPIKSIDDEIVELARNMVETMHAAPGIGLAAPQVNVSKRLITVDLSVGEKPDQLLILINPEFLETEGESVAEEGCLSVPGIQEKVKRPARVRIRGIDLQGKERILEAEGLLARVFCHEIDHINGKLFIENLSPLKRSLIKKKLKKDQQAG